MGSAGIVYQNINGAAVFSDLVKKAGSGTLLPEIAYEGLAVYAKLTDLCCRLL